MTLKMRLERILASTCRQKIIKAAAKAGQIHMMELVRRVNSTHDQVSRNLKILIEEKIVVIKKYGRVKIIQLNGENERTLIILKALNLLERGQHEG